MNLVRMRKLITDQIEISPCALLNTVRHHAVQLQNGAILHISLKVNGIVNLKVSRNNICSRDSRKYHDICSFHGIRENSIYLRNRQNRVYKCTLDKAITVDNFKLCPSFPTDAPPPPIFPSIFQIDSGPYRAFREGSKLIIRGLEHDIYMPGDNHEFIVDNIDKSLDPHIAGHSAIYRGCLLIFFFAEHQFCQRVGENQINVYSPILENLNYNTPISPLVYAQNHNDFVYLIVPSCERMLIVDTENLRICDCPLSFEGPYIIDKTRWPLMNLIGVHANTLSIGVPGLAPFGPETNRVCSYTIWTGTLPEMFDWIHVEVNPLVHEIHDDSNTSKSSWNIDFPELPTRNRKILTITSSQQMTDPEDKSELVSLREKNSRMKEKLALEMFEEENIIRENEELIEEGKKADIKYSDEMENLLNELKIENTWKIDLEKKLAENKSAKKLYRNVALRKYLESAD